MQTLYNGVEVFTDGDPYNLSADVAKAFRTANVTIDVASQAQRDGLAALAPGGVLPVPTFVYRTDLSLYETWNGSAWRSPIEGAAVVTDANWSATGVVTRSQTPSGVNAVTVAERMLRTAASFTLTTSYLPILVGFIPAGFRPANTYNGWALLTNASDAPVAAIWWRVTPSGDLQARLDSGSVLVDVNHRFNLSGNWTAA